MTAVAGSGSAQLAALAARLKVAGEKGLKLELSRGLKAGASPLIRMAGEAARAKLPHGGGLNEQVAGQKVTVSVLMGARTASVRMTTTAPDTKQTDAGGVRHPVFARKTVTKTKDAKGKTTKTNAYFGGSGLGYSGGLGYGDGTKVKWVYQEIPNAKGWWSQTLAHGAPVVTPELTAVMERISAQIQGGI